MSDKQEQVSSADETRAPEGPPRYEPPKLEKFEKLEKLILSGE